MQHYLTYTAVLLGSNIGLASIVAIASVGCLTMVIAMVRNKKTSTDKKIASALAHAIREDML